MQYLLFQPWLITLFYSTFHNNTFQNDLRYDLQLQIILFTHKNVFTSPVTFTGSNTKDEPNFPPQNNIILQEMVSGIENE